MLVGRTGAEKTREEIGESGVDAPGGTLTKPTHLPLDINAIKGSERWRKMADFERGWYVSLLIEAADNSERPGWLVNDMSVLWAKAGAKTMAYFQREGQRVLACFSVRTEDGRFISNPKLLATLKNPREREVSSSSPKHNPELQKLFEEAYENYPRHVGKRAAEKAFYGAIKRKCLPEWNSIQFAATITRRAREFASSPSGQNGKFTPHMSTWLNQDRFLDDPTEWGNGEAQAEICRDPEHKGRTNDGRCWVCRKVKA